MRRATCSLSPLRRMISSLSASFSLCAYRIRFRRECQWFRWMAWFFFATVSVAVLYYAAETQCLVSFFFVWSDSHVGGGES